MTKPSRWLVSLLMVCVVWLLWVATASAAPAIEYSLVLNVTSIVKELMSSIPVVR